MLPMSDGIRLFTRVVLPKTGKERVPVVFMRTPYHRETEITEETFRQYENDQFLCRGFGIVLQHCRGRYGSEGECIPYSEKERSDGLETLGWLRKQAFYNGELFFSGASYTASVLMLLLDEPIPDLSAICFSVQTESMYHRNYVNGLCRSFCGFEWWLSMISGSRPKIAADEEIYKRPYVDIMKRATGKDLPAFTNGLLHDRYDEFWKNDHRIGIMESLNVPILMVSGWFDYYCYGMSRMWEKLPEKTRKKSVFFMNPFGHGMKPDENADYVFPNGLLPPDRAAVWFESIRNKTPYPYAETGKFTYYSIGEDRWKVSDSPYRVSAAKTFYFRDGGRLSEGSPEEGSRSYLYDPDCPTHHDKHDAMFLMEPENSHEDVLSFVSGEFKEPEAFFGPIEYRIEVSTDCDDTSFFLRFCLVEDGKAYNLVDAVTTILHGEPSYKAKERCTLVFQSQPTAFFVKPGGRIRVDISSYTDCFHHHANTQEHFALAVETKTAGNTVYFGESRLTLFKDKKTGYPDDSL